MSAFTKALVRFRARLSEVIAPVEAKDAPLPPLEWTHVMPGDAILIQFPPGLTREQSDRMKGQLEEAKRFIPDGVRFIVSDSALRASVVRGAAQ